MWVEIVRAKWGNPFSSLRRERFELDLIKDLILDEQLKAFPAKQITRQLGAITRTMPTEQLEK